MNTVTIVLPWIPILGILTVGTIWFSGRGVIRVIRKKRANAKAGQCKRDLAQFDYPWNMVYETCRSSTTWQAGQAWLKNWLKETDNIPTLSLEKVELLMTVVASTKDSESYLQYLDLLAPHLDIGYGICDYQLKDKLPEPWYRFWMEIKNYPGRDSLFYKEVASFFGELHQATKVPLTTEQATLLAHVLGNGQRKKAEYYAQYLSKFVTMKTEDKCFDSGW